MKRNTKHTINIFVLSHLCTEKFLQWSPVAGHFQDNELCPIRVTPGSSLFPELWPDPTSLAWMTLRHLKPSMARAKLCSPHPPYPNTLLLVFPTSIRCHQRPETMRPILFALCLPHNRLPTNSISSPEHIQTLPTLTWFKLPPLPSGLLLAPYCSHWFHPNHLHLFTAR